jgi:hypothetical protein
MTSRNLQNLLAEVVENFESDPEWANQMANEIKVQFEEMQAEFKKSEKIYKKMLHYKFALDNMD